MGKEPFLRGADLFGFGSAYETGFAARQGWGGSDMDPDPLCQTIDRPGSNGLFESINFARAAIEEKLTGPKCLKKGFLFWVIANAVVEAGTSSDGLGVDRP